jgi:hypothetical protein
MKRFIYTLLVPFFWIYYEKRKFRLTFADNFQIKFQHKKALFNVIQL